MRQGLPSENQAMNKIVFFFTRLGLKSKFIIITTMAIVIVMGIIGYIAVERENIILYTEVEREGRLLGETLAIPIINDLIYERLGLVEEGGLLDNYILEIFNRHDVDLLYITIINEEGRVISHNNITEYGKVYSDPITMKAMKANETIIQTFKSGGHIAVDFGIPLSIGKKRWGTLKFAISLEKVERQIIATVTKIVILTLFMIVSGFIMILLLSRRFISPITQLASTMDKTRSDYLNVKVDVKGHDELAVLGERFNSMIERIRQANEELKKTHERLVQSEKMASIGILASGVAHEINNPLGGLYNCLQMLNQQGDDPGFREKYISLIKEGLDRIENTVSKLLWISRRGEHKPKAINVRRAVNDVYSFVEYKLRKNRIVFDSKVGDDVEIFIDPHDFQQMTLNLFINAMHAMENGGTLSVGAERVNSRGLSDGNFVEISVEDTGIGIPDENIIKVFDPFFTTKPPGEGTGLGLWLTYEIVKNYNGEISVESEVGKGSRFVIRLPETQSG